MTADELADACADIFVGVFIQVYPQLTVQFVASELTAGLERRIHEIREKIVAGDEMLFDEFKALSQQWGIAVLQLDMAARPKIKEPEQVIVESGFPEQKNLFAGFQKSN